MKIFKRIYSRLTANKNQRAEMKRRKKWNAARTKRLPPPIRDAVILDLREVEKIIQLLKETREKEEYHDRNKRDATAKMKMDIQFILEEAIDRDKPPKLSAIEEFLMAEPHDVITSLKTGMPKGDLQE